MYVNKELDDDFWHNEFKNAAKSVGMDKLAVTVTRMCQLYLGLNTDISWCNDADEDLCGRVMKNILSYGNFGRKHSVGIKTENVTTGVRKYGLFRYLQMGGELTWNLYHKHRWLKPFCWLFQIGRLMTLGVKTGWGVKTLQDIENSNERYELLRELNIVQ